MILKSRRDDGSRRESNLLKEPTSNSHVHPQERGFHPQFRGEYLYPNPMNGNPPETGFGGRVM